MRRLLAAVSAALFLVVLLGDPAGAHSTLVSSDPADGTVVETLPETIELIFTEPVSAAASTASFVDADGNEYDTEIRNAPDNASALLIDVGDIPDGLYSLRWSAFSTTDGHVTRGMLVWGVGDVDLADAAFAEPSDPANPLEVVGRWVLFGALALALGAGVLAVTAVARVRQRYGSDDDRAWHESAGDRLGRIVSVGVLAAALAAAGLIVLQVWNAWRSGGLGLVDVIDITIFSSRWGNLALARLALLVLAVVVVRRRPTAALPALIGAVVAHAASGHAGGLADAEFAIVNDAVHLLTSLTWGGAIVALAALGARAEADRARFLRVATVREFSTLAVGLGVATAATGLFAIGRMVQSVDGLVRSGYGQMLSFKVGLVIVLALLGLAGRRLAKRDDRTLVHVAAPLVAGIVLLAAAITATSTATGGEWLEPTDGTPRQLALVSNDIQIGLAVTPNVPGQNFILIDAASTRRPVPAPIARVLVRVDALDVDRSRTTLDAEPVEPVGSFEVPTTMFSVPGRYRVEVVVRRLGLPDETATFEWSVATPDTDPAAVSHKPLADFSDPFGGLVALVGVGLLGTTLGAAVRRERRVREVTAYAASAGSEHEVQS